MSYAEITANNIYNDMCLQNISDEVRKHLIILLQTKTTATYYPSTLEEAMQMGAVDLETARKDLHEYVDSLSKEYHLT